MADGEERDDGDDDGDDAVREMVCQTGKALKAAFGAVGFEHDILVVAFADSEVLMGGSGDRAACLKALEECAAALRGELAAPPGEKG